MGFVALPDTRPVDDRRAWMSLGDSEGMQKRRMTLYLRPSLFGEVAAAWFGRNKTVQISIGTGQDAGFMRIEPGGHHKVLTTGGPYNRGGIPVVRIFLPVPQDAPSHRIETITVSAEVDEGGLLVRLPEALVMQAPARPVTMIPQQVAPPPERPVSIATARPPSRPFTMIGGVPDPAAVLQAAQGRRVR